MGADFRELNRQIQGTLPRFPLFLWSLPRGGLQKSNVSAAVTAVCRDGNGLRVWKGESTRKGCLAMPSFITADNISDLMKFPHRHGAAGAKLVDSSSYLLDYSFDELLDDILMDATLTLRERGDVAEAFRRCQFLRNFTETVLRLRYFVKAVPIPSVPLETHQVILRTGPSARSMWKVDSLEAARWVVIFRLGHFLAVEP